MSDTVDVRDMGPDEARERVERVKAQVAAARSDLVALWRGRAWLALGYASWDALCDAEYGVRMALPRDERREAVAELRAEGMPVRAIGPTLGLPKSTVHDDLKATRLSGSGQTEPERVTSLDGRERPATRPTPPPAEPAEPAAPEPPAVDEGEAAWREINERAEASGLARQMRDERPYGIAAVVIQRTTRELAELAERYPAAVLGERIPGFARDGFEHVPSVTRFLDDLMEALA